MIYTDPTTYDFRLTGEVQPLAKAVTGPHGHRPTRSLGGWLMVYAMIGPNGGLQPVQDREGQVMEAARELGRIDWRNYLAKGLWNDTHNEDVIVGHATNLEFHDETTPLAKAHGKTGFWTQGHLFDRADPDSWRLYTKQVPREDELRRSDDFWTLAQCLKGTPRPLALSAHGMMQLSPCGRRILAARCDAAAVCELPINPAATVEPLEKARQQLEDSPLRFMRKGLVARADSPCRTCRCAPGAACLQLRKGLGQESRVTVGGDTDSDDPAAAPDDWTEPGDNIEALIAAIQDRFFVSRADAARWIAKYLRRSAANQEQA